MLARQRTAVGTCPRTGSKAQPRSQKGFIYSTQETLELHSRELLSRVCKRLKGAYHDAVDGEVEGGGEARGGLSTADIVHLSTYRIVVDHSIYHGG